MCRWSASDYDLYVRTGSKPGRTPAQPGRSLVEVFRDLIRPRRTQVEQAEVLALPARLAVGTGEAVAGQASKAA